MKLSICTDVMGDMSFTDMLDKCVDLGVEGIEMTGGGEAVSQIPGGIGFRKRLEHQQKPKLIVSGLLYCRCRLGQPQLSHAQIGLCRQSVQ